MSVLGTAERPLQVAIVGSGPSGFYAAEALLKSGKAVEIGMFDRLPTPFGLVRGGVAPDHPKIKSVTKVYEKIAGNAGFSFFGNVCIGRDISLEDLREQYDAVLLACGAETDNRLGIPGEDLPGSHTATEFVGWYNGHPDYRDRVFDLSVESAVVVGQGNVAMDVARILAKTADELRDTDIAAHALEALAASRVRDIHLVGRRGPAQAKFTPPELKELGELSDCDVIVDPASLELNPASEIELASPDSQHHQKNMALLRAFAGRAPQGKSRRCHFHFLRAPAALEGSTRLERFRVERTWLSGEPFEQRAAGSGEFDRISCGILFRSVGYRGVPVPGAPFDERRGVIPNTAGRVSRDGSPELGLYVAGWIKRGPSGVIGTNKPDSQETVEAIIADMGALQSRPVSAGAAGVQRLLDEKGLRPVSFDEWRQIDAAEIARGKESGKPREKFTRIQEMLAQLAPV